MSGNAPPPERMSLLVGGQRYGGWLSMRLTRKIDRMATDFDIAVSERWRGQDNPWQIRKFDACQVLIGSDPVMTGYVDAYEPTLAAAQHGVRITGRSKTMDLVDCMPDLPSGQFKGYTLDAIARAMAAPFGIEVVVQTTQALPPLTDTMLARCETAYEFLERLARLSGVMLTDDEQGRLVLATTGSEHAHDALALGSGTASPGVGGTGNVLRATAKLDGRKQFSRYVVKGQHPINAASTTVQTGQQAVASDPSVPRFRQHVSYAEGALTAAGMQARVRWQAIYAAGRSTMAHVTVQGWRQSNGDLWRLNTLVATAIPYLEIDQDLLIAGVQFQVGPQGQETELTLGPPEGFTPDPGQVRVHKKRKGRKGKAAANWSGAADIQPGDAGGAGGE